MRTARQSAVQLLQLMMVASLVLPAILFVYASWLNYRNVEAVSDERIERSLDILHEHALKVFQTVERTFAEVDEVTRGMSDDDIRAEQQRLHLRIKRIVDVMPQLKAILVVGRDGRPLVSSSFETLPADLNMTDRDYFKVQAGHDMGTDVSDVRTPTDATGIGTDFFNLTHRRASADGSFNGIIVVAVLPSYFDDFYALIGQGPGSFYAMVRTDGSFLSRYPSREVTRKLDPASGLRVAIERGQNQGLFWVDPSQIDGQARRVGFLKLPGFPIYVLAGTNKAAMMSEWLSLMKTHLIFGLPATLLIFTVLGVALQRTQRLHDEAERREAAEAALRQSQRLEAIGQLTGGVAHDFNNLLMIIGGSAQRMRRDLTDEKQVRLIEMIANATQRGESLTRQLLAFSRRQTLQPSPLDLCEWMPKLKDMLSRSLRGDIETRVVVPDRHCTVKVDPSEFELALLNLAFNARDAMTSGGTLTITVKPVVLRGKAAEEGLRGEFVAVRVTDTGNGIPNEVISRVFEPFFTTKEEGKGTGLGLSQVYGFAKQSGGTATVTSTVGRGTAVTLFLPRTWEVPAPAAKPSDVAAEPKRAGTVLLVEDNAEVAEVGRSYLEQLGYRAEPASGAQAALDVLEREKIDLVFSDILMPGGMNGVDLAHAIRARFPHMPVLLATGFSSSAQDAVRQGFEVLQKPYDIAALERGLTAAYKWADRQRQPEPVPERAVG
jgi:two-component system NtrC family sensor kinase